MSLGLQPILGTVYSGSYSTHETAITYHVMAHPIRENGYLLRMFHSFCRLLSTYYSRDSSAVT